MGDGLKTAHDAIGNDPMVMVKDKASKKSSSKVAISSIDASMVAIDEIEATINKELKALVTLAADPVGRNEVAKEVARGLWKDPTMKRKIVEQVSRELLHDPTSRQDFLDLLSDKLPDYSKRLGKEPPEGPDRTKRSL